MKKHFVIFGLALCALSAQASYLYWQVDSGDYSLVYGGTDISGATIYAVDAGGGMIGKQNAQIGDTMAFDVGDGWSNYSFYVEVMRSSGGVVATSEQKYGNLDKFIGDTNLLSTVPMAQVWHGGTIVVPEPTSGFLMMVGLALLGLKRRKV